MKTFRILKITLFCLLALTIALAMPQVAKAAIWEVGTWEEFIAAGANVNLVDGDTIKLTADITPAPGSTSIDYPVVGMDTNKTALLLNNSITIDLNNHSITDLATPNKIYNSLFSMTENAQISIKNGTISGFDFTIFNLGKCDLTKVDILNNPYTAITNYPSGEMNLDQVNINVPISGMVNQGKATLDRASFESTGNCQYQHDNRNGNTPTTRIKSGKFDALQCYDGLSAFDLIDPAYMLVREGVALVEDNSTYLHIVESIARPIHHLNLMSDHIVCNTVSDLGVNTFYHNTLVEIKVVNLPEGKIVDQFLDNGTPVNFTKPLNGMPATYRFNITGDIHLGLSLKDAPVNPPVINPPNNGGGGSSPSKPTDWLKTKPQNELITIFTIGKKTYEQINNGTRSVHKMDVAPYIQNDRAMLPVRFVGNALKMVVSYNDETRSVTLTSQGRTVVLQLDSQDMTINGTTKSMLAKPEIVDGRTMLPIGEIAAVLDMGRENAKNPNGTVNWNAEKQEVTIIRH